MTNEFGMTSGNTNYGQYGFGEDFNIKHDGYDDLLRAVRNRFNAAVQSGRKLFTTDSEGLYAAYLNGISSHHRQYCTCRSCEQFIERFGGLVTINKNGKIESVLWNAVEAPPFYKAAVRDMKEIVLNSKVNGVFVPDSKRLGTPVTGVWTHFSVDIPQDLIHRSKLKSAYEVSAQKKEDYRMLQRAIADFKADVVDVALELLQSDALFRSEKNLEKTRWFKDVIDTRNRAKGSRAKENIVWLAAAAAPTGFTHIRSGSLGVLLESISSGLSFAEIKRKVAEIMDPSKYQRPQAAPKAGNIAQAERIFKTLGLEDSLHRRFARVEELNLMWRPNAREHETRDGIFGHLYESKPKTKMNITAETTMTWRKFAETVLPFAEGIEYQVKAGHDNYSAILTSVYPSTPPILQWDREEQRNPFSWYVYRNGSPYSKWNVRPGYVKVTGITLQPSMWYGDYPNQGKSVYLLLEGAKDTGYHGAGNAIFPETLKSELHEVRSTIEKYSRASTLEGYAQASACGVRLQSGNSWNAVVRVTTKSGTAVYKLDRWD